MVSTSDFKKGLKLLVDDEPYSIIDFNHFKPGKGNSITRTKLKHLISGSNLEKTFKSGEKFKQPDVEYNEMDYLYNDDTGYHFMNPESYDQIAMAEEDLTDFKDYLTENMKVKVCFYNERAVTIEIPLTVELEVADTEPGFKGNTVTGGTKPATLQTGLKVNVPLHINIGDTLKINTLTGEYLERVSK
ncbi:MAG: elongation factor P [Bdellovibrionaceae bacterium]|nr:elongation factor P [Pseudobdellovibrionaceae bacterium]|tara:strand:+ start:154188 stop:154751 length:564 start_codon:yes stop_codon:yes gene_type:complete